MAPRGQKRTSDDEGAIFDFQSTPSPKRSRKVKRIDEEPQSAKDSLQTPTKRQRGRPPGSGHKQKAALNGTASAPNTSKLTGERSLVVTPKKAVVISDKEPDSLLIRNVDRSARRKSTRNLLSRSNVDDEHSDSDPGEDTLARKIWEADEAGSSDEAGLGEEDGLEGETSATAVTPSKRKPGRRKQKSPTPPQDLPPHEQYFWQNRPGRLKTSDKTLSSLSLLTHEQYHNHMKAFRDPHASSFKYLHVLHARSFPQWRFELHESFNICLYGYGSKQRLVQDFASYLYRHSSTSKPPKILMVNAFSTKFTLSIFLTSLASVVYDLPASSLPKLPAQPSELVPALLTYLTEHPPSAGPFYIFINSLDSMALRRGNIPSLLSHLAAHPSVSLLATCDNPSFPILWDVSTRDRYNFVFHDATTFISYAGPDPSAGDEDDLPDGSQHQAVSSDTGAQRQFSLPAETSPQNSASLITQPEIPDVISDLSILLNRSTRTIKGKEGVAYVLRSLPENARSLYRILVSEILAAADADADDNIVANGDLDEETHRPNAAKGKNTTSSNTGTNLDRIGIEYRTLYRKTVEEFVCSSEMSFRQLLKEFWDHDMVVSISASTHAGGNVGVTTNPNLGSSKTGTGTEVIGVPFRREECEAILEELI